MKPEETIKTIEIALAEVEWNYPLEYSAAFEMAIKALKNKIPKKPRANLYDETLTQCPVCFGRLRHRSKYERKNKNVKFSSYCDKCGQAIDWSE